MTATSESEVGDAHEAGLVAAFPGGFPEDEAPATPEETREEFLSRSRSGYTKVRHAFVQSAGQGSGGSQPALLPMFSRNHRAAVLYLAVLANWPWLSQEAEPLPADAWIRFLSCDSSSGLTWTPQSLSHAWGVLEALRLVARPRHGRLKLALPLREDGNGEPYTAPKGKGDPYLVVPNEFWIRQLHATLSWPALAVLLILLKETGNKAAAPLAVDSAQRWYGISRTTAEEGLAELRNLGILVSETRQVKVHQATGGRRLTSLHMLLGEFSTHRREQLRNAAKRRVDERATTASTGEEVSQGEDHSTEGGKSAAS